MTEGRYWQGFFGLFCGVRLILILFVVNTVTDRHLDYGDLVQAVIAIFVADLVWDKWVNPWLVRREREREAERDDIRW